jgi:hypothetical protein
VLNRTDDTSFCSVLVSSRHPVRASQIFTPSPAPETIRLPSVEYATAKAKSVCPRNVRTSDSASRSQTRTVWS